MTDQPRPLPTAEWLDALENLLRTTTPTPWKACGGERGGCQCGLVWSVPADVPVAQTVLRDDDQPTPTIEQSKRNALAIAALVTASGDLLAGCRRALKLEQRHNDTCFPDDPLFDATDGAHPAWWRGHDHTAKRFEELRAKLEQRIAGLERENAELRAREAARTMVIDEGSARAIETAANLHLAEHRRALTAEKEVAALRVIESVARRLRACGYVHFNDALARLDAERRNK